MARTAEERAVLVRAFGAAPGAYAALLEELTPEEIDYQPAPGKWSARQVIAHVLDTEAHVYTRLRYAVAEPGRVITPFDQDAWAHTLGYSHADVAESVEAFRVLRDLNTRLLERLEPEQWQQIILHPERGHQTIEQLAELFDWHARVHIEQIERNRQAYAAQRAEAAG